MFARVTTASVPVDRMKEVRGEIADQILAKSREIPGVKKLYAMADETTGKMVAVVLYDTEADLVASREAANKVREEIAKVTGGTIQSVEEFEVVGQI
jgi:hypothetical protein